MLFEKLSSLTTEDLVFVGYAADGYPIYISKNDKYKSSYRLKNGKRVAANGEISVPKGDFDGTFVEDYEFIEKSGDLDIYNGKYGKTKEYPNGIYYYVITKEFPYIPRGFQGEILPKPKSITMRNMNFYHPKAPGIEQTPKALREYPRS